MRFSLLYQPGKLPERYRGATGLNPVVRSDGSTDSQVTRAASGGRYGHVCGDVVLEAALFDALAHAPALGRADELILVPQAQEHDLRAPARQWRVHRVDAQGAGARVITREGDLDVAHQVTIVREVRERRPEPGLHLRIGAVNPAELAVVDVGIRCEHLIEAVPVALIDAVAIAHDQLLDLQPIRKLLQAHHDILLGGSAVCAEGICRCRGTLCWMQPSCTRSLMRQPAAVRTRRSRYHMARNITCCLPEGSGTCTGFRHSVRAAAVSPCSVIPMLPTR